MEKNFSDEFKKDMVLIYVRESDNYFRSYHLGEKKIIIQKVMAIPMDWYLLNYFAAAITINEMNEKDIDGKLFVPLCVARWLHEGKIEDWCDTRNKKLNEMVASIPKIIPPSSLPDVWIWNSRWGRISPHMDSSTFWLEEKQVLTYKEYLHIKNFKPKAKKKKKKGWVDFDGVDW